MPMPTRWLSHRDWTSKPVPWGRSYTCFPWTQRKWADGQGLDDSCSRVGIWVRLPYSLSHISPEDLLGVTPRRSFGQNIIQPMCATFSSSAGSSPTYRKALSRQIPFSGKELGPYLGVRMSWVEYSHGTAVGLN